MCNLKSNKTLPEMLEYKKGIKNIQSENIEFVLFPTFIYLPFFYDASFSIGSQNVSKYKNGNHTGEVIAKQLKSLKVTYVLLNHAEVEDTPNEVIEKIRNATNEKIKVVLCIGEKRKQKKEDVIRELRFFINVLFSKLTTAEQKNCILAYEPAWAIQKKDIVEPSIISYVVTNLKKHLKEFHNIEIPILYGGSITLENIQFLTNIDNLDGYLIGNFANNPENIVNILNIL